MAEMPITINGVICDLYGRTIQGPVKIVGSLVRSDVGVGGGPIMPPDKPGGGGPPTIWPGPGDPDFPGGGGPPSAPPSDPTVVKPPPASGGWGWVPDYGWGYFPGPGEPEPKK